MDGKALKGVMLMAMTVVWAANCHAEAGADFPILNKM